MQAGRYRAYHGLTLLELLFSVVVIALLLGLSLPGFRDQLIHKRFDVSVKSLITTLELARVTAITDNSLVTLCKSSDGESCGGNWQDGVIVFADRNGDRVLDQEDRLVRYQTFPHLKGTLKWRAFQNRQYLQITPQGFTRYQNGNFTFCPSGGESAYARQIILNRSGRIRIAMDSDNDGFRENSKGEPIDCS